MIFIEVRQETFWCEKQFIDASERKRNNKKERNREFAAIVSKLTESSNIFLK